MFINPGVSAAEQADRGIFILALDGPADATVTDPLGRTVGPAGVSIPDAEYVSDPSDPFKLIIIPNPEDGQFNVDVTGGGSGVFNIGLLDTFNPVPTVVTDIETLWDSVESQIEPAATVEFKIDYTLATSSTTTLIAETPVIEVPVKAGDVVVNGKALPGSAVEIRDADTSAVLGSGATDGSGHFAITVSTPLNGGQRIYPWSNGVSGVPVIVEGGGGGTRLIFLPIVVRNY